MQEISPEILLEEYIKKAFEIQVDKDTFNEICEKELPEAIELVKKVRAMNHPVRIISQPNAPIVIISIDATPFNEQGRGILTVIKIKLSKLVKVGAIDSPNMPWGNDPSGIKFLASKANEKMDKFLDNYFTDKRYIEDTSHKIPNKSSLFFDPKEFPHLNDDAFGPDGDFHYEEVLFSDLFGRFSNDERLDQFIDERLEEEFGDTRFYRKEVTLTKEEFKRRQKEDE